MTMIDLPAYDPASWQNRAQCATRGVDPNLMQPERATRAEVEEAKAVCVGCPVLAECRAFAEEQGQRYAEDIRGAYGVHAGEWFGVDPAWQIVAECEECGDEFRAGERSGSRAPRFCGVSCGNRARQRARRLRDQVSA